MRLFLVCWIFLSSFVYAQNSSDTTLASLKAFREGWLERLRTLSRAEEIDLYRRAIRGVQVRIAQKLIRKEFNEPSDGNTDKCWVNSGQAKIPFNSLSAAVPSDKFTEALALYHRELPQFFKWIESYSEIKNDVVGDSQGVQSALQSYLFFELLNEKSALSLIESMNRLLTFLESERLFLILRYDEFQDLTAEILYVLQELVSLSLDWQGGVLTDSEYLKKLEAYLGTDKNRLYFKEGLDHLLQVLIFELNFRLQTSQTDKLGFLHIEKKSNTPNVGSDSNELAEVSVCVIPDVSLGLDAHFETIIALDSANLGEFTSQPVLKPWPEFVESKCQVLNKWQTNHNFNCSSDFQEGCNRLFATVCKPIP